MRIALDAMGGDHGPARSWPGPSQAVAADPDLTVVLVGDQAQLEPLLAAAGAPGRPARGRSTHAKSSTWRRSRSRPSARSRTTPSAAAGNCWPSSKVDGIVSAGNTGAMVAGGLQPRRFLKGVHRPGIATVMPTAKGRCVIIDVGANVFPEAAPPVPVRRHGRASSPSTSSASSDPTIGLMNVGEEEGKGHDLVQETLRPVPQQPAEGPVRRQRRGPRHPPRGGRRGRHRRVRRQRGAQAVRGRLRVRDEDGRPGGASGRSTAEQDLAREGAARAGRQVRLQRLRRGPAAGHRRRLHHLPRQSRSERAIANALGRGRPGRPRAAEREDRRGTGSAAADAE